MHCLKETISGNFLLMGFDKSTNIQTDKQCYREASWICFGPDFIIHRSSLLYQMCMDNMLSLGNHTKTIIIERYTI